MKKVIQVPMEPELLDDLDEVARLRGIPRAELVREACQRLLAKLKLEEMEHLCIEGYLRMPEGPEKAEVYEKLAAEVWEGDDW